MIRHSYPSTDGFIGRHHSGASVQIDREPDGRFYIIVKTKDGASLYEGWAPTHIATMHDAKREALRGAGLAGEIAPTQETPCPPER